LFFFSALIILTFAIWISLHRKNEAKYKNDKKIIAKGKKYI